MDAAGHEEVERPRPDADGHPQHDRAAAGVDPADRGRSSAASPMRHGRPLGVLRSVELEQQRIAAPFEQAGSPVIGLVEERAEDAIEGVAHDLGADLALPGKTLGQRGEPGDVDEDEGRLALLMQGRRRIAQPLDHHPRDIRFQVRRCVHRIVRRWRRARDGGGHRVVELRGGMRKASPLACVASPQMYTEPVSIPAVASRRGRKAGGHEREISAPGRTPRAGDDRSPGLSSGGVPAPSDGRSTRSSARRRAV
jgi:hypothetical protein